MFFYNYFSAAYDIHLVDRVSRFLCMHSTNSKCPPIFGARSDFFPFRNLFFFVLIWEVCLWLKLFSPQMFGHPPPPPCRII